MFLGEIKADQCWINYSLITLPAAVWEMSLYSPSLGARGFSCVVSGFG